MKTISWDYLFTLKLQQVNFVNFNAGEGVLSGKVGMGTCSSDRVPFWPPRFTNDPFYLKIGLDIGSIVAKCLIFDEFFL